ncbi:MAG: VWA domain-containing protein [Myxococcota bacterium]|nr:VWA domain-containing protein [Myxococcota bacterium]
MVNKNRHIYLYTLALALAAGCAPDNDADQPGSAENHSSRPAPTMSEADISTPSHRTAAPRAAQATPAASAASESDNTSDNTPNNTSDDRSRSAPSPEPVQGQESAAEAPGFSDSAAAGGAPAPGIDESSEADVEPEDAMEPNENWIQLSTDDSTSMASAQMFKIGARWANLKAHEFLNYYDPPADLFQNEGWTIEAEVTDAIQFGVKAIYQTTAVEQPDNAREATGTPAHHEDGSSGSTDDSARDEAEHDDPESIADEHPVVQAVNAGETEVLFQLRAEPIDHDERRNWNLFLCVDVSGSMRGEKMDFTKQALLTMLDHLKAGDRISLVTFDSVAHDIFIDLEISENESAIRTAFQNLQPGSSTNMIAGLNRTYELAQDLFNSTMLQRVILFGDGRANVGETDLDAFADLTRINGQEGIYLSGVGVGRNYDADRMDQLTDAGKGAHVFLPNADEVDLIFGDYFPKLVEVAADQVAIEMTLPKGIYLESFSGEEVSTNPDQRLQNIVLAAGDDMTFVAKFKVESEAELDKPASIRVTLRPLSTGRPVVHHIEVEQFSTFLGEAGHLFKRTQLIHRFGEWAATGVGEPDDILEAIQALSETDWGLTEIAERLSRL